MNNLNILYEDNHIIVVVKPYNVLSQADDTKDIDMLTIIKDYLKEKYNKKGNVYLASSTGTPLSTCSPYLANILSIC